MGGTMQPVVHSVKKTSGRMGQPVVHPPHGTPCVPTMCGAFAFRVSIALLQQLLLCASSLQWMPRKSRQSAILYNICNTSRQDLPRACLHTVCAVATLPCHLVGLCHCSTLTAGWVWRWCTVTTAPHAPWWTHTLATSTGRVCTCCSSALKAQYNTGIADKVPTSALAGEPGADQGAIDICSVSTQEDV
jgi:hypothetical protein